MLIVALRKGPLYTMCAILHFYLNIHVHANALMCIYIAWQAITIYSTCIQHGMNQYSKLSSLFAICFKANEKLYYLYFPDLYINSIILSFSHYGHGCVSV